MNKTYASLLKSVLVLGVAGALASRVVDARSVLIVVGIQFATSGLVEIVSYLSSQAE